MISRRFGSNQRRRHQLLPGPFAAASGPPSRSSRLGEREISSRRHSRGEARRGRDPIAAVRLRYPVSFAPDYSTRRPSGAVGRTTDALPGNRSPGASAEDAVHPPPPCGSGNGRGISARDEGRLCLCRLSQYTRIHRCILICIDFYADDDV